MTDAEVLAVQQTHCYPAQRLVVALAAVHAAAAAIRQLTLDDLAKRCSPGSRTVTAPGPRPPTGTSSSARRRRPWGRGPSAPNTSSGTSCATASTSNAFRGDRVLHEALAVGADPLHLALVFNLSHTTASRYAAIAQSLLDAPIEQTPEGGSCSRSMRRTVARGCRAGGAAGQGPRGDRVSVLLRERQAGRWAVSPHDAPGGRPVRRVRRRERNGGGT
jgi:hypothetical protein